MGGGLIIIILLSLRLIAGTSLDDHSSHEEKPEMSNFQYYFLLTLVIIPVKLFFDLWGWLGWELFKNN